MDETVFDAMLKTALEEALRQDAGEAPEAPPSRRQERRMRRLLAGPWGRALPPQEGEADRRRSRSPARWLAVAIVAALLGGAAAASYVLGDGQWFQQWFAARDEAGYYGSAANTDQLSDLGAGIDTPVVEHDGLRFEVLDAVSDGQRLMISVRMSLVSPELLALVEEGYEVEYFEGWEFLPETELDITGSHVRAGPWPEGDGFRMDQYSLIVEVRRGSLSEGGAVSLRMKDLGLYRETEDGTGQVRWPGEWTLTVTSQPIEPLILEPKRICQVDGVDWMLDRVTLSPLTLQFSLHCLARERQNFRDASKDLEIHMKDGTVIDRRGCSRSGGYGGHSVSENLEFPMPLDLEQVDYLRICGQDIYLEG